MSRINEIVNVYVQEADTKMIYRIASHELVGSAKLCYLYTLELVAGYDYVTYESDIQGYVPADRFIEAVQTESIIAYPMDETLRETLEQENFIILDKLPHIYDNKEEFI